MRLDYANAAGSAAAAADRACIAYAAVTRRYSSASRGRIASRRFSRACAVGQPLCAVGIVAQVTFRDGLQCVTSSAGSRAGCHATVDARRFAPPPA